MLIFCALIRMGELRKIVVLSNIGGEGRIRTYGPVAQTAAFRESRFDSATLAPLPRTRLFRGADPQPA